MNAGKLAIWLWLSCQYTKNTLMDLSSSVNKQIENTETLREYTMKLHFANFMLVLFFLRIFLNSPDPPARFVSTEYSAKSFLGMECLKQVHCGLWHQKTIQKLLQVIFNKIDALFLQLNLNAITNRYFDNELSHFGSIEEIIFLKKL